MDELTVAGRGSRIEAEELIVAANGTKGPEEADPKKPQAPGTGDEPQQDGPDIPWQGGPDNPDIPWQGGPDKH